MHAYHMMPLCAHVIAVAEIVLEVEGELVSELQELFASTPVPVRVRSNVPRSMMNRWLPDPLISSEAVFVVDDDLIIQ